MNFCKHWEAFRFFQIILPCEEFTPTVVPLTVPPLTLVLATKEMSLSYPSLNVYNPVNSVKTSVNCELPLVTVQAW